MTELCRLYVRTEVCVERKPRRKRKVELTSKKSSGNIRYIQPVPQTDTGGRGEYPKALE